MVGKVLRAPSLALAVAMILAACGSPSPGPPPALTQLSGDPVRDFVTATYPHGVPYDDAVALGPQSEAKLIALLADTTMTPDDRINVATVLCILQTPKGLSEVVKLIEQGTGELPSHEVRVRANALLALGYAAYTPKPPAAYGDSTTQAEALDYLRKGLNLSAWPVRLKWTLPGGADPSSRLRLRTITALGLSGNPAALGDLQTLPSPPAAGRGGAPVWSAGQSEKASIDDAIRANQYIAANGMSKYYSETYRIR